MKFFLTLFLCFQCTLSLASETPILNKTITIGHRLDFSLFTNCVAEEAQKQVFPGDKVLPVYSSKLPVSPFGSIGNGTTNQKPWLQASFYAFFLQNISLKQHSNFIILTSLDSSLGWQLVEHSSGRTALFTNSISPIATFQNEPYRDVTFSIENCRHID